MYKSIYEIQTALAEKSISLPELVSSYLSAIDSRNHELNILTDVHRDEALASAKQIQDKIEQGKAGPLAGCVVSLKDVYAQKDQPLTCGSSILQGLISVYNAEIVDRLLKADAIIIGRANMDEFAMGSSNEYSVYGPTRNPLNPDVVPGGSSGASAASIAADFCNASIGSDTGGSVRQPASYTATVGLKPTYGRISRYGLVAYASSFDTVGPMGKTVGDVAGLLHVLAGQDEKDNSSSSNPVGNYLSAVQQKDRTFTIGIPNEYFSEGLDPEIRERVEEIIRMAEGHGHTIQRLSLPHTEYGLATYYILATAEASSNLARYDGIRYGNRQIPADSKSLRDLYIETRTKGFGDEVKRRILLGTYVLSKGYYDSYYGKAQKVRRLIREDFELAFQSVDVILSPSSPTTAFKLGEKADPLSMYLNDVYTLPANLAGICAVSIPAGTHSNGLPFGIQFQAASFQEEKLLQCAAQFERYLS